MERDRTDRQQARDTMFCHQCENEWYRDEGGLTCPECHSDFAEIIEPDNDPREDEDRRSSDHDPWSAPDPDEGDIGNVQWRREEDGSYTGTHRIRRNLTLEWPPTGGEQASGDGGSGGAGFFGSLGSLLGGVITSAARQAQEQRDQQRRSMRPRSPSSPLDDARRPAFVPGSARDQDGQPQSQRDGGDGTFVRHYSRPGFSFTIASSNTAGSPNMHPGLNPRDAYGPQPFQAQPEHLDRMMAQMLANIGALPGVRVHAVGSGGAMHPLDDGMFPGSPAAQHAFTGMFGPLIGPIFAGAMGGRHGDAVYSQEALDRVITELMERHQAGNAPGPATQEAIRSLPTRTISKDDLDTATAKADCSICMDEVPVGGQVTVLPCSHWFHFDCIEAWLKEHDTCPHCRQGIMPKDGPPNGQSGQNGQEAQPSGSARQPSQAPLYDLHSPEYARPANVPGAFPFPRRSSGGGPGDDTTGNHPFHTASSPTSNRRRSDAGNGPSRRSSRQSSGGLLRSMRDAFGGGSSGGGGDPTPR